MKKSILSTLGIVLGAIALTSCVPETEGQITVSGSTTVTPVMRELQRVFYNETGISVYIQEIGTSSGITATIEGGSDLAMSSRELRDDELTYLTPINFAIDGMVVIVNASNNVRELTLEEVYSIFSGEITNWSYVGGNDAIITVVSREDGSGARASFESFIGLENPAYNIVQNGTGGILAAVSSNENAIGYITTGGLNGSNVIDIALNGVRFSSETVLNGSYPFANNFYIAHPAEISDEAAAFIEFILSNEGQAAVEAAEYVRIN